MYVYIYDERKKKEARELRVYTNESLKCWSKESKSGKKRKGLIGMIKSDKLVGSGY
jgi:hypothetical protein